MNKLQIKLRYYKRKFPNIDLSFITSEKEYKKFKKLQVEIRRDIRERIRKWRLKKGIIK